MSPDKDPTESRFSRRELLVGALATGVLAGCAPVGAERPSTPSSAPANPGATPGETEAPQKVDVMNAPYEKLEPLTNDELFGPLPADIQPESLAKLSLDQIRERMSARIDPHQANDKDLIQTAVKEIMEKQNAYMRLASANVYSDDISKLEELGVAAWQGVHNHPSTKIPPRDTELLWKQTAIKYRSEAGAKLTAESPIGGELPRFPTASGTAYDEDSIKLLKRETDGTLVLKVKTRFIIKDDGQRIAFGEMPPATDTIEDNMIRVKVDKTTGELDWTTVRKK